MSSPTNVQVPEIPEVPAVLRDSSNMLAKNMVPVYNAALDQARSGREIVLQWRQGIAALEDGLKNSDLPEVAEARRAKTVRDERAAKIEAEFQEQIKDFVAARDSRVAEVDKALSEKVEAAKNVLSADSGVTAEQNQEALASIKAASDTIDVLNKALKAQNIDVGRFGIPSFVQTGKRTGDGAFTPRFEKVVVRKNQEEPVILATPTTQFLADYIGRDRDFIVKRLENQVGGDRSGWDRLEFSSQVDFDFKLTNLDEKDSDPVFWQVSVWKKTPGKKSNAATGETVEESDDDDEDSEEDSEES